MTVFRPSDAAETAGVVAWAVAEGEPLDIVAGGSKRALGRPSRAAHTLDVSRLAGVVDYEPSELVLTARPGTPMAEVEALLAGERQMLAFEPPDWRGLLGCEGEPTLGGALACNIAGPRRVRAGAARDHFLGFAAVNGRGEAWKAGGRVVKNVTGYDMCKLQAGAYGTLSVLTEVSVKVLPRPEAACTLLLSGLSDAAAVVLMAQALNTPHEVSGVAHLPEAVAARCDVARGHGNVTALRLEGPPPSVRYRADALEALMGAATRIESAESARFWQQIGAVRPLLPPGAALVWRVCPTPSAAPAILRAVQDRFASTEAFFDWGGGLLWLCLDATEAGADAGAAVVRAAVQAVGGHATLVVAPGPVRMAVAVFEPEASPLAALSRRVKDSFDPRGILNPGRMREGQ